MTFDPSHAAEAAGPDHEWPADPSTAVSATPSVDMIDQWTAERTGRPIAEVRADRERQSEIDRRETERRDAEFERELAAMTLAQAVPILNAVIDDPDSVEHMGIYDWGRVERAWGVLCATLAPIVSAISPSSPASEDDTGSWLVDTIAEVLANGGPVDDERGAAHDVAETLIQARHRVFDALGLTQRHLLKDSTITEERTVWVDQ
jgi:hypothetical protein